jgi:hypothetical protein
MVLRCHNFWFIDPTASPFRGLIKVGIANFHRHHRYQRARCGSLQDKQGLKVGRSSSTGGYCTGYLLRIAHRREYVPYLSHPLGIFRSDA